MRLGLIGTGKQGQRYLLEKNGGRHITVSGSRRIPLDDVDGVIIATHPAGHKELALECIAAGKAVLIEKPLALNLHDCMDIIDAAEKAGVHCEVAHTRIWDPRFNIEGDSVCRVSHKTNERDYSAWLDWAPHGLALLATAMGDATPTTLRRCLSVESSFVDIIEVQAFSGEKYVDSIATRQEWPTPMWLMLLSFMAQSEAKYPRYDFNRRVYRALFAE